MIPNSVAEVLPGAQVQSGGHGDTAFHGIKGEVWMKTGFFFLNRFDVRWWHLVDLNVWGRYYVQVRTPSLG